MTKRIEAQLLKLQALAEADELLRDKSSDFKDGFHTGVEFLADFHRACNEIYGRELLEQVKDRKRNKESY